MAAPCSKQAADAQNEEDVQQVGHKVPRLREEDAQRGTPSKKRRKDPRTTGKSERRPSLVNEAAPRQEPKQGGTAEGLATQIPQPASALERVLAEAVLDSAMLDVESRRALARVCRGFRDVVHGATTGLRGDATVLSAVKRFPRLKRLHITLRRKADEMGWQVPSGASLSDCPALRTLTLEVLMEHAEIVVRDEDVENDIVNISDSDEEDDDDDEEDDEEHCHGDDGLLAYLGGGAAGAAALLDSDTTDDDIDSDLEEVEEDEVELLLADAAEYASDGEAEAGAGPAGRGASRISRSAAAGSVQNSTLKKCSSKSRKGRQKKAAALLVQDVGIVVNGLESMASLKSLTLHVSDNASSVLHGLRSVLLSKLPMSLEELTLKGDMAKHLGPMLVHPVESGRLSSLRKLMVVAESDNVGVDDVQATAVVGLLRAVTSKNLKVLQYIDLSGLMWGFTAGLSPLSHIDVESWDTPESLEVFVLDGHRENAVVKSLVRAGGKSRHFGLLMFASSVAAKGGWGVDLEFTEAVVDALRGADRLTALKALCRNLMEGGGHILRVAGQHLKPHVKRAVQELVAIAEQEVHTSTRHHLTRQLMVLLQQAANNGVWVVMFVEVLAGLAFTVLEHGEPRAAVQPAGDGLVGALRSAPDDELDALVAMGLGCSKGSTGAVGVLLKAEARNMPEPFVTMRTDLSRLMVRLARREHLLDSLQAEGLLPHCCSLWVRKSVGTVLSFCHQEPAMASMFADVLLRRVDRVPPYHDFGRTLRELLTSPMARLLRDDSTLTKDAVASGRAALMTALVAPSRLSTLWESLARDAKSLGASTLLAVLRDLLRRGLLEHDRVPAEHAAALRKHIDPYKIMSESEADLWVPFRAALWGGPEEHLKDVLQRFEASVRVTKKNKLMGVSAALLEETVTALAGLDVAGEELSVLVDTLDQDLVSRLEKLMLSVRGKKKSAKAHSAASPKSKLSILGRALGCLARSSQQFLDLLTRDASHTFLEAWIETIANTNAAQVTAALVSACEHRRAVLVAVLHTRATTANIGRLARVVATLCCPDRQLQDAGARAGGEHEDEDDQDVKAGEGASCPAMSAEAVVECLQDPDDGEFLTTDKAPVLLVHLLGVEPVATTLRAPERIRALVRLLVRVQAPTTKGGSGSSSSAFFVRSCQDVVSEGGLEAHDELTKQLEPLGGVSTLMEWKAWQVIRSLAAKCPNFLLPHVLRVEKVEMVAIVADALREPSFARCCVDSHLPALVDFIEGATTRRSGLTGLDVVEGLMRSAPFFFDRLRALGRASDQGRAKLTTLLKALSHDRRSNRPEFRELLGRLTQAG